MVLTTVPWYKDFLQVEYPSYAYSEPDSDTSTTSLDRFSPLRTPPPATDRRYNSLGRHTSSGASRPGFSTQPRTSPKCTRASEVPAKPPRPNYVLRRSHGAPLSSRSSDVVSSPTAIPKYTRPAANRLSYSLDDKTKRFGNLQYFEDFQLPEKPASAGNTKVCGRYM